MRMVDPVELPSGIVERVFEGLPVVYPTTTLPALGCLPQSDALDSLFELKKRSDTKIVSLGVCDLEQAANLVEIPDIASSSVLPASNSATELPLESKLTKTESLSPLGVKLVEPKEYEL